MPYLLILLTVALIPSCDFFREPLGQKAVLDVNGRQMTAADFAQELAFRLRDQDALSAKDPKLVGIMKDKIVEEFTVQVLTEAWAREQGLVVKAEELDEAIRKVQQSYPDDLAFQMALAQEGLTFRRWRDRLHGTLLQKVVVHKVVEAASLPTDGEAQAYYQSNRSQFLVQESAQVRQILTSTENDAKTIEKELKRGKRLTELAKKYSISPEGEQGGMVGWVEKGLSEVFEPAFRMRQGQRSAIIRSDFGFHIFEVTGRKPARTRPFKEVKDEIKRILMEKNEQSLYLAWLEEQVRKARVFKDQAFIDALRVETKTR